MAKSLGPSKRNNNFAVMRPNLKPILNEQL